MNILIIGSGPVGGILASCLSDLGLRVVLVDKVDPAVSLAEEFDGRTSAIAKGSLDYLASIGLSDIFKTHAEPIKQIRVSELDSHNFTHFDSPTPMGYIIENRDLRQYLYDNISSRDNIEWLAPATVEDLQTNTARINGKTYQFDLCIAADGRNSVTREHAGIKTHGWSYDQTAFVGVIEHSLPHNNIAFEHFTPSGPIAFLPMQNNRSSLVWSVASNVAPDVAGLSNEDFCSILQERFGNYLGHLKIANRLWQYPLSAQYATSYYAPRLALAGDAAHTIHPVAGQGLNLGIRDCEVLSKLIAKQISLGLDIGSTIMLEQYQKQRMFDNASMLTICDSLVKGYSNNNPILNFIRGKALTIANTLPPLRDLMVKHATGTI